MATVSNNWRTLTVLTYWRPDGSHRHLFTRDCHCEEAAVQLKQIQAEHAKIMAEHTQLIAEGQALHARVVEAIGPGHSAYILHAGKPNEKIYPLNKVAKVAAAALVGLATAIWGASRLLSK